MNREVQLRVFDFLHQIFLKRACQDFANATSHCHDFGPQFSNSRLSTTSRPTRIPESFSVIFAIREYPVLSTQQYLPYLKYAAKTRPKLIALAPPQDVDFPHLTSHKLLVRPRKVIPYLGCVPAYRKPLSDHGVDRQGAR